MCNSLATVEETVTTLVEVGWLPGDRTMLGHCLLRSLAWAGCLLVHAGKFLARIEAPNVLGYVG